MYPDASITIAGTVKNEQDLESLVWAIRSDEPSLDWPGPRLEDAGEIREIIASAIAEGRTIEFKQSERRSGEYKAIQDACKELGLSFILRVDVSAGPDGTDPGHTLFWKPGLPQPISMIGCAHSGGPFPDAEELQDLIDAGRWDEVKAKVDFIANHEEHLPRSLSAAFDLDQVAAATP